MSTWIFPEPHNYSPSSPPLICDRDRVLALYNQDSGFTAMRVTERVEEWFLEEAFSKGWAAAAFVEDAQTGHSGGCILMSAHALQHARSTGTPTIRRIGR